MYQGDLDALLREGGETFQDEVHAKPSELMNQKINEESKRNGIGSSPDQGKEEAPEAEVAGTQAPPDSDSSVPTVEGASQEAVSPTNKVQV